MGLNWGVPTLVCLSLPPSGMTLLCSLERLGAANVKNNVTKEKNAPGRKVTGSGAVEPPSEGTVKRMGPLRMGQEGPDETTGAESQSAG